MDAVLRAAAIYIALLIIFRISGRRTLSEITTFDLILVLIVGEATQQAMLGQDHSFTNALLVIMTLVFLDILISYAKMRSGKLQKVLEGVPTIIVENGRPLHDRSGRRTVYAVRRQ